MKYSHIESAKEAIAKLDELMLDPSIPFEARIKMAHIYGSFKVVLNTYEGLWDDRYGINRLSVFRDGPILPQ